MIISHEHKFVYISIPRTASKSMCEWLMNYGGEYVGYRHEWRVPPECKDYFVFTVVRNPYERAASGYFCSHWVKHPKPPERDKRPLRVRTHHALARRMGTLVGDTKDERKVPEHFQNQYFYCKRARVSMVLHFERLPQCLTKLPFVDEVTNFPRADERVERPSGNFFAHFNSDDEQVIWTYANEVFHTFGYQRYSSDLPTEAPEPIEPTWNDDPIVNPVTFDGELTHVLRKLT